MAEMIIDNLLGSDVPYTEMTFPSRLILLEAGCCADKFFFIRKGAVRRWFNQDGKDVTLQFFFEGSPVCSFESFFKGTPSDFYIETIETSDAIVFEKSDRMKYAASHPAEREQALLYLADRMIDYTHQFLSWIKNKPEVRYEELQRLHPEILQRVPQHYCVLSGHHTSLLKQNPVSYQRYTRSEMIS